MAILIYRMLKGEIVEYHRCTRPSLIVSQEGHNADRGTEDGIVFTRRHRGATWARRTDPVKQKETGALVRREASHPPESEAPEKPAVPPAVPRVPV